MNYRFNNPFGDLEEKLGIVGLNRFINEFLENNIQFMGEIDQNNNIVEFLLDMYFANKKDGDQKNGKKIGNLKKSGDKCQNYQKKFVEIFKKEVPKSYTTKSYTNEVNKRKNNTLRKFYKYY
jgi:hypothetical protein